MESIMLLDNTQIEKKISKLYLIKLFIQLKNE